MSRRPPPHRRADLLDALFERLAREVEGIRFDPDLPRRVAALARTKPPGGRHRGVPAWAAIAAAVLVALGVGTGSAVSKGAATAKPAPPPPAEREALPEEEVVRCDEPR